MKILSFAAALMALAFCILVGGCTFLTVTTKEVPPQGMDQQRAYHARLLIVEDGKTTRADVERLLGEPDYVEKADREAAYRWQVVRYEKDYPDYFNLDPEEGLPTKVVYFSLLLQFDERDVIRAHQKFRHKVEYGGPPSLPQLLTTWQTEWASQ